MRSGSTCASSASGERASALPSDPEAANGDSLDSTARGTRSHTFSSASAAPVADTVAERSSPAQSPTDSSAPFPWPHVLTLSLCQLLNTASYMSTTPLAPFMVLHYFPGLEARDVGFYTGLLEGAFHVGAVPGAFFWSWFADHYGRRPALLCGLVGTFLAVILFGFAPNYATAIFSRLLWGLLNGNVGVIKTSLSERASDRDSGRAFSMFGLTSGVGRLLGPAIGGLLAHPARRFGWTDEMWVDFPFSLSCVVMAALTLIISFLVAFLLEETKGFSEVEASKSKAPPRAPPVSCPDPAGASAEGDADGEEEDTGLLPVSTAPSTPSAAPASLVGPTSPKSWISLFRDEIVFHALSIYAALGALGLVSQEVLPLLLVLPRVEGGFSMDERSLGILALSCGIPLLFTQAFLFPPIVQRAGVIRVLSASLAGFALTIFIHPALTLFADLDATSQWCALIVLSWLTTVVRVCAFTAVFIVVANSAKPADRARVNGLGQALVSVVRAVGPPIFTPLFAASVSQGAKTMSAATVWIFLAGATGATAYVAHILPVSAALKRL
jgi:MFS family permease